MSGRIIINIWDDTDPTKAVEAVAAVVNLGKISKAAGLDHYAWHVTVGNIHISTNRKRNVQAADSFSVYTSTKRDT